MMHTQKVPVCGLDWYKPKSGLDVHLTQVTARAQFDTHVNGGIKLYILHLGEVSWYEHIDCTFVQIHYKSIGVWVIWVQAG